MNKSFSFLILLFLLMQCNQKETVNRQSKVSGNNLISEYNILIIGWESLLTSSSYVELRESVEKYLNGKRMSGETISFYAYYFMAQSYMVGPFETGISYCDSALATKTKELYLYEKCQALKGTLLRKNGDYRKSIDYLVPLIVAVTNDSVQCEINWQLSISYRKKDLYDSAIYYSQKAEQLALKLENRKYQYYAIQSMANIHSSLGEYEVALSKEKELVQIAQEMGKKSLIVSNTANLAVSYFDLDRKDSALYFYEKAQTLAKELNDLENQSLLYTIYANYLIDKEQYKEAKHLMLLALDISEQSGRKDIVLRSYLYLCLANIGSGDYEEAISYAKTGIALAKQIEASAELGGFYELLADIFQKKGDYRNAYNYSEEYRLVMDSVLNVSKIKTIKELDIKYNTEKKSKEIELLNSQAHIQNLKIQQRNWVIIGAVIFFTILVLMLISFYRQRSLKRNNEMLSLQQKLFRSQLNPHFIFNALTAIQKFVIKNDPLKGSSYMAKFSQLMRQVLEHSREEFIPFEDEIKSLTNYLDLQQLRFDNKFEYTIDIDNLIDRENLKIPPMFVQPFIENAIEHGIKEKLEGKIDIRYAKKDDLLHIYITDNGEGLRKGDTSGHISRATEITKERMHLLSKKGKHTFHVSISNVSESDGSPTGVRVAITLPYKN